MSTYRVGDHHGVIIVREGDGARCGRPDHDCDRGHLVGVMLTTEDAELVVAALNGTEPADLSELALRFAATKVRAIRPGLDGSHALAAIQALVVMGWRPPAQTARPALPKRSECPYCAVSLEEHCPWHGEKPDSCICTKAGPDPACPVHQGRRARGPKPPPLGPGCTCDGSGRTCPRHGVVV